MTGLVPKTRSASAPETVPEPATRSCRKTHGRTVRDRTTGQPLPSPCWWCCWTWTCRRWTRWSWPGRYRRCGDGGDRHDGHGGDAGRWPCRLPAWWHRCRDRDRHRRKTSLRGHWRRPQVQAPGQGTASARTPPACWSCWIRSSKNRYRACLGSRVRHPVTTHAVRCRVRPGSRRSTCHWSGRRTCRWHHARPIRQSDCDVHCRTNDVRCGDGCRRNRVDRGHRGCDARTNGPVSAASQGFPRSPRRR